MNDLINILLEFVYWIHELTEGTQFRTVIGLHMIAVYLCVRVTKWKTIIPIFIYIYKVFFNLNPSSQCRYVEPILHIP